MGAVNLSLDDETLRRQAPLEFWPGIVFTADRIRTTLSTYPPTPKTPTPLC